MSWISPFTEPFLFLSALSLEYYYRSLNDNAQPEKKKYSCSEDYIMTF